MGNWWKTSKEPNKDDEVQRLGKKYRNWNNQGKIENEGRDEVNEGAMQESDNIGDVNDENVDINNAASANEEPIRIIGND